MSNLMAKNISQLVESTHMSKKALAKVLHIDYTNLQAYTTGTKKPPREQIIKIADYFGVSADYVLGRTTMEWDKKQTDNINGWVTEIHSNAIEHGWWEDDRSLAEVIALCHSELSEALEADRKGQPMSYYQEDGKPDGIAVEMMDCVIRILDWFGKEGIDAERILEEKHEYNRKRPYKHGKRY